MYMREKSFLESKSYSRQCTTIIPVTYGANLFGIVLWLTLTFVGYVGIISTHVTKSYIWLNFYTKFLQN